MRFRLNDIGYLAVSAALGAIFVYSGIEKCRLPHEGDPLTVFHSWVQNPLLQRLVGAAEIALGVWLIVPARSALPRYLCIAALCAFSGILFAEATKDRPKPCGCSGSALAAEKRSVVDTRFELRLKATQNLLFAAGLAGMTLLRSHHRPHLKSGGATWLVRHATN